MEIYFPSMPSLEKTFSISQSTVQLSLTFFLLGFGFSQLFYGPFSDYYGRRPLLLIGFAIYICASFFLTKTNAASYFLVLRLFQGLGAGAGASLCRVLLRDVFIGDEMAKGASFLTIGIVLATSISPAVGGFVQEHFGYIWNFSIMFLFGVIVTALLLLYLPETNQKIKQRKELNLTDVMRTYLKLLFKRNFILNSFCSGLALSVLLCYGIMNPFLLQNGLNISPALYGIITLVIALGEVLGSYMNGLFVMKFTRLNMRYLGIFILGFAGLLLLITNRLILSNITGLIISSFFATASVGIIIPNVTADAFSELKTSIGAGGALYGFFQIVVTILATLMCP